MKHLTSICITALFGLATVPVSSLAQDGQFYLKPYFGLSTLSDKEANSSGIGNADGSANITIDSGFVSGLGFGYRYDENLAAEIAWEYRRNDSEATLANGSMFSEGNYASNIVFLNGYYSFDSAASWKPYVGGGLGWIQEIDIDFGDGRTEQSYSGDGDIVFQLMAGAEYPVSDRLALNAELRYFSASVDLEGEDLAGRITDIDYDPVTLQIGLSWSF